MTKSECRAEITRNENLIATYNSQISTLQNEITELDGFKSRLVTAQSSLTDFKSVSTSNASNTSWFERINQKIINGLYNGINNIVNGNAYKKANDGFSNSITKVATAITNKNSEITSKNQAIAGCNSRIQEMYNRIAAIEAWEEKQRKLEEQRKAAEAAKNTASTKTK